MVVVGLLPEWADADAEAILFEEGMVIDRAASTELRRVAHAARADAALFESANGRVAPHSPSPFRASCRTDAIAGAHLPPPLPPVLTGHVSSGPGLHVPFCRGAARFLVFAPFDPGAAAAEGAGEGAPVRVAAPRDEEVLARSDWLDVELERAGSAAGGPGAEQGPSGACAAVFVDGAYVGGVCGARGSVWVGARPGAPALGAGAHRLRVVRARLGGLAADAGLDFGPAAETGFLVRSGRGGGGSAAALEGFAAPAGAEWVWADGASPAGGAAARWLLQWEVREGGLAALLGRVGVSVAPAGAPPPPSYQVDSRVPHPVLIGHAASLTPY